MKTPRMHGDAKTQNESSVQGTETCEMKKHKSDVPVRSYWVMWLRMNSRRPGSVLRRNNTQSAQLSKP